MLTQERLKDVLDYDPEVGSFIWIKCVSRRVKIGDIAGGVVNGYIHIMIDKISYKAHRLVWMYIYGVWPKEQIDHINHNKKDNRLFNLREATCQENQRNAARRKDNVSGVTGVYWNKKDKKWRSQIKGNGKNIVIGRYDDKFEAICARKSADNKYGYHPNHGMVE